MIIRIVLSDVFVNAAAPDFGTRQIANTNYGVCVRMAQGYCGIEWSQTAPNSFTVSGDTGSFDSTLLGKGYYAPVLIIYYI